MRSVLLVAIAACSAAPTPASAVHEVMPTSTAPQPPPTTGEELIQRVVAAYAAIESYQDAGEVVSNWADKDRPDELRFKLRFREPDRIRFVWLDHHPYTPRGREKSWRRNAVWSTGGRAHVFMEDVSNDSEPDVASALRATMGVSQGVSGNVPGLLVDGMKRDGDRGIAGLLLLPSDVFENVPCFRVKGHRDGDTYELWIGQSDYLIRKIVETPRPGFLDDKLLWTAEIHRDIVVNRVIDDAAFEYEPPPSCVGDPFCPPVTLD